MRVISFLPLVLPVALAGPFTFPSQPNQRHETLTVQDGRPQVLTSTQTTTQISTTTFTPPTPPTLPGSSGPRRTGRPDEDELELRAVFAPTGSSDPAASASTSSSPQPSSEDEESDSDSDSDSDSSSDNGESETATSVQQIAAAAQTTPAPPANDPGIASALAEQGHSQVTYYTCKTRDATLTHCGWHVPVIKVSAASERGGGSQGIRLAALCAACAIAFAHAVFGG
ncbi:hypothetical protein VSDG_09436 [Cytospora chrysosperma]|uniref:Uncharacterized protein n=1 Tax=Cytospora chrysosperma TaxID=252740 RepID=A0A423VBN0_CYTCH|nr:hypothetical protein VSDG_09436 [Valsa sordida]